MSCVESTKSETNTENIFSLSGCVVSTYSKTVYLTNPTHT